VELSAHAMFVPVCASVSKLSVNGEPRVVMLPLLVNADEGLTNIDIPMAKLIMAIKVIASVN